MKYKKGDTVRIKNNLEELIFDLPETFANLCKYAGRNAKIVQVLEFLESYVLTIDGEWNCFREEWLETVHNPISEENHPMSAVDILREISMLVEIMGLKEFDIQCTEGVINFTMAKNVEE